MAQEVDCDTGTGPAQPDRDGPSNTTAGAGYQGDFSGELVSHGSILHYPPVPKGR
ncbi:MAG TPA: hypothetical protein VNT26_16275 [Candidatus Sulfotelmatobacter sp.]|nr:hypothetical protein [Candidatus Sulfotelmatobacter sp.]